jgi:hypothetical protein
MNESERCHFITFQFHYGLFFKLLQVGTVALVALTGLITFMLVLLVATINAVIVSLLISLAVAGGFLALFFAFVTAIYIGALSVAIFAISTVMFWTTVAILITTGNWLFAFANLILFSLIA